MYFASEFLITAALLIGPNALAEPADAGLSAAQPRITQDTAAPAEMGVARLRRLRLTVTGEPGRRVLLGMSPADQPAVAGHVQGLELGPLGLVWIADGSRQPSAVVGLNGRFEVEIQVPDGLPIGTHMIAQAITIDAATGQHDLSPALDLRVEEVLEFQFTRGDAGWRSMGGGTPIELTSKGLSMGGPSLLIRPLQGLQPGAEYRIEMGVGLGFDTDMHASIGLSASATSTSPGADPAARTPFDWESVEGELRGTSERRTTVTADRRGRLWLTLDLDRGHLVIDHATVRIGR